MNSVWFLAVGFVDFTSEEINVNNLLKPTFLLLAVIFLQGCNDDDDHMVQPEPQPAPIVVTTIVDAAVSNGNFTTLVAALQATGLDATLADTSSSFTVFAPTDDAFALLGQATIDALLNDTATLSNILTYHVYSGAVNAETAISLAGTTVEMVNGDMVALSLDGDSLLVNTATVTMTDIQTDNGIIHVIDAVLMPPAQMIEPTANIVETAVANGNFTTLVAALQAASLDAVLADDSTTFTVFAPTDDAFNLIGADTINALLANTDVLAEILLQHVISGQAVDAVTAYSLNGTMVETAAMNQIPLAINSSTDSLTFGGANIVMADIYTTNGIIHVIDAVVFGDVELPTPPMSLVDVAASNSDFSILVGALQQTGLDSTLAALANDFTVFAPTNDAFAKLPAGTLESLDNDQLSNILLYHVLPDTVLADAAITVAQSADNKVTMANSDMLALSFANSTLFANGARISMADVMADNGVIHAIDNVIIPVDNSAEPTQSIVEIAVADPDNFSTLVDALTVANLVTTLADENSTFTVFAPTNAAFAKINPDDLNALLADVDALTNVLLSHVVSGAALSSIDAFAVNGQMVSSASGNDLSIAIDPETGQLIISGSTVTITDIKATNGIIHVIDTVITE